jgi:hypothetical protein
MSVSGAGDMPLLRILDLLRLSKWLRMLCDNTQR